MLLILMQIKKMMELFSAYIARLQTKNIDVYVTIIIAFAIGLATLTPVEKLPNVSGSDKLYHLLSFTILTFTIGAVRPKSVWWILILRVAFGGAIEMLQPLVNRSCEFADFLADACGAALGIMVSRVLVAVPQSRAD
jgi:VanZ family protein